MSFEQSQSFNLFSHKLMRSAVGAFKTGLKWLCLNLTSVGYHQDFSRLCFVLSALRTTETFLFCPSRCLWLMLIYLYLEPFSSIFPVANSKCRGTENRQRLIAVSMDHMATTRKSCWIYTFIHAVVGYIALFYLFYQVAPHQLFLFSNLNTT